MDMQHRITPLDNLYEKKTHSCSGTRPPQLFRWHTATFKLPRVSIRRALQVSASQKPATTLKRGHTPVDVLHRKHVLDAHSAERGETVHDTMNVQRRALSPHACMLQWPDGVRHSALDG
eukprot:4607260-Amphidinium_carterae.1